MQIGTETKENPLKENGHMPDALAEPQNKIDSTDTTTEDRVSVRVDTLLIGSTLSSPLYDNDGVLLLAEGSKVTSDVMQALRNRKMESVSVSPKDASRVTLDESMIEGRSAADLAFAQSSALEPVIDKGLLFIKNEGPAAQERMVFHGRKAFDQKQRENLILQHQSTSESLDSMMKEAASGKRLNGKQINQLAATYLTDMAEDSQNVLTVAMEADKRGLSEQSLKTALLAMSIGVEMKLNEENVRHLGITGLVQDWGMTKVPGHILDKTERLNAVERIEIQKHPIYTLEMLEALTGIPGVVPLVAYQVHERPDGTGYPRARTDNSIHLFAKIIHVADIYTALTSRRPYRKAITAYSAIECLLRLAQMKKVDADVVRALLNVMSLFPIGSYVVLSDGSVAQVIRPNRDKFTQPIIQVVRDANGERVEQTDEAIVDLTDSELHIEQAIPTPGRDEMALDPKGVEQFALS